MKHNLLNQVPRSLLPVLGSVALLTVANADEPSKWQIGGSLDFYYQYDFNKSPTGTELFGRQYDVKHNNFSLASARVSVVGKPVKDSDAQVTLELQAGRNAEIDNIAEPGGTERYKYIRQLFLTYPIKGSNVTLDFGKFVTNLGYEVGVSGDNENYGRSFLFTLAQPLYHTGLRATKPLTKTITATAGVVNGWNEVDDSNGQMSFFAGLTYAPTSSFSVIGTWYGGIEGSSDTGGGIAFPATGKRKVSIGDLVATYQVNANLKLGLNADLASAGSVDGSDDGNWKGVAGYAKYQFTPKFSLAARYETFSDYDGLRTGADSLLTSATLTAEYKLDKATQLRLEYRSDASNRSFFPSDDLPKKHRNTVSVSVFFRF